MSGGQQKGAGTKKHGRNKAKCERYRRENRRERSKLKHIFQSSGIEAARKYAVDHLVVHIFQKMEAKRKA